jgi:maleylpyruvate isomerase
VEAPILVRGDAASVLGWLVGRGGADVLAAAAADGTPVAVPSPPRWL